MSTEENKQQEIEDKLDRVSMELPLNWKWMLGLGIFMLLAGTLGIGMSVIYTIASVLFIALLIGTSGVLQIVQGIQAKEEKWSGRIHHFLIGLLYAVTAGLLYWNPVAGAQGLTLIVAAFFIVAGILRIVDAIRCKRNHWRWVLPVFLGLINFVLAFLIVAGWPGTGLWIIGLFIAIELIMNGWFLTLMAFRVKNTQVTA